MTKNKVSSAMFFVLLAGLIWSFGPLVVRNIDNAEIIPWQYSLIRGFVIFLILNIYLFLNEGGKFTDNYKRIGLSGLIGGICLGIANITFVFSITTTTAAVTLMMLGAMPFIAALLAFFFLKETISKSTLIAMIIAATGIILISFDSKETGTLFGLINGLISSSAFAGFTVSLRWRKKIPKLTTVSLGGIIAASISLIVLFFYDSNILISLKNTSLSALHGFLVCSALILYSSNAKYLPAAELTLLSLTEVLGGIFWVWLPLLGINEIPSTNTIIGGIIIIIAIIFYGYKARRYRFRY
jgi:DME family drug/metabolite transporter|tara:strand:+ start:1266 stop:2159 length:894 start_codon:yes stop_codon:yes gene_type:complete